jgi:hypothetical protein
VQTTTFSCRPLSTRLSFCRVAVPPVYVDLSWHCRKLLGLVETISAPLWSMRVSRFLELWHQGTRRHPAVLQVERIRDDVWCMAGAQVLVPGYGTMTPLWRVVHGMRIFELFRPRFTTASSWV